MTSNVPELPPTPLRHKTSGGFFVGWRLEEKKDRKPAILMAEDDEEAINIIRFLLEREGYELHLATDGRQAMELIDNMDPPRLILLDIMLPYVSGLQLLTHIRQKTEWQTVPIIMVTAKTSEEDVVRALDNGANDYVAKPFSPKELLARLKRFVRSAP